VDKIPSTPLYERGALHSSSQTVTSLTFLLPPFFKGGTEGGFFCAFVLSKINAASLLSTQSLTLLPTQQVGFESANLKDYSDLPGLLEFLVLELLRRQSTRCCTSPCGLAAVAKFPLYRKVFSLGYGTIR